MSDSENISPLIRAFMHVALLRRLGSAQSADQRKEYIDQFLSIRTHDDAAAYISRVRTEARIEDLINKRRTPPPRHRRWYT